MEIIQTIIIFSFLGALPGTPSSYGQATSASRRALMEDAETQEKLRIEEQNAEHLVTHLSGLSKQELAYIGAASPLLTQTLSTKPIKSLEMGIGAGFKLRPELDYHFGAYPSTSAGMFLVKTF